MKQYTIPQNKHRARPIELKLWVGKKVLSYKTRFTFDCKYDIGADHSDWNKLYGIGFIPVWKVPFALLMNLSSLFLFRTLHHDNSARFVWRYFNNTIQLGWYVYVNKQRYSGCMYSVPFNRSVTTALTIKDDCYVFRIWDDKNVEVASHTVAKSKTSSISFMLGGYFGGNRKAPNKIVYSMKML